jgi:hypothetical protein
MALSATFTANFASFYDAVDKAEAKLKDFGQGADKVGGRLNALANSFSGQKIIQDATLMAKAVEEIGGVTKLTDKELARLGATANEAVAKMKALGMDVPKNLQQIADTTKKAQTATTDWLGTLTKIAGAVGIAFSVDAIVGFIASVFDAASAIKDLSLQWGVSTKFVQQWSAAARGSGVDAQTVGKSIQFLTDQLSESSEEYNALLANIGLSGAALRKLPLEDAYRAVIKAIGEVEDETLQLDLAMGLLGPGAKQLIGAIRDGMYEAADAQDYMTDQTVKRLADAEGAWKKYKDIVVIYSAETLSAALGVVDKMTSSWDKFFSYLKAAANASSPAAVFIAKSAVEDYTASLKKVPFQIDAVASHGTAGNAVLRTTAQVKEDVRKKTEAHTRALAESARATKEAQAAQDKYNKSVDDLVDTFRGGGLIDKANLYVEALKISIPVQQMTTKQQVDINRVMWDAITAYEAAGTVAPKVMYDIWIATAKASGAIKDFKESLPTGDWITPGSIDLGKAITLDTIPIENQLDKVQVEFEAAIEALGGAQPKAKIESFDQSIDKLAKSFAQLGQITGGVFGDLAGDIAATIGAMQVATEAGETFRAGMASFGGGQIGQGLTQTATAAIAAGAAFLQATEGAGRLQSALQGMAIGATFATPAFAAYGAAVGFAAGYVRGFFNEMKNKEARKEFAQFKTDIADAAGGIEAFNERARHAGTDLGMFLHAATGEELSAAMNQITAAINYQKASIDLVIETAEKYGFTLEELGPAMQRQQLDKQAQGLWQDWQVLNAAGLETVLITEKMADSVNEYVNQAMAMGVEVPNAMRPMLEAMARSGNLIDANGEAITDLEDSGISFALTMSDGFKALINEVKHLTEAISRELGLAIKDIPQPQVTGKVTWDVEQISQPHASAGGEPLESYQQGTDGFKNFGKGTPVMLHGWEAVVPREDSGAFATVAPGGTAPASAAMPSIIINAQGAFFDTPDSLQRLANRVGEALTARYSVMGKLRAAV